MFFGNIVNEIFDALLVAGQGVIIVKAIHGNLDQQVLKGQVTFLKLCL